MFNKIFKGDKLSIHLFIIAALAALIMLPIFLGVLRLSFMRPDTSKQPQDKYYLNRSQDVNKVVDPMVTRVPKLKDILAGPILSLNDPNLGLENAKVVIVEYSDFNCSFCQEQEKVIKRIMAKYQDKVRFIWKDYPENNDKSDSWQAAVAGRCAQNQGKFWPYHDLLFAQKVNFTKGKLLELATSLSMDKDKFSKCLNSIDVKKPIIDNIKEANTLEITGVPFVYINDQELMGQATFEDMSRMIEMRLKDK